MQEITKSSKYIFYKPLEHSDAMNMKQVGTVGQPAHFETTQLMQPTHLTISKTPIAFPEVLVVYAYVIKRDLGKHQTSKPGFTRLHSNQTYA